MRDFNNDWLDELKYKSDIVEVISRYVPLQKKGGKYFGCCPFHHEKTASFCVNPVDQYYHCFGCGVSGDVIKFIMEIESVDFIDACSMLAEKVGMVLPDFKADANYNKNKEEKTRLFSLMHDAAIYYYSILKDAKRGEKAREYLIGRGITEEYMKGYGFGLCDSEREVAGYLMKKGYKFSEIQKCGLVEGNEDKYRDAFFDRIIVPIFNSLGKVVAFGGRIYKGEVARAKYKNSTNTELFDKSRTIYGANFVKKLKLSQTINELILVEGYMDVISLGVAGIKNAVAGMGTALTDGQARELRRLCPIIYVCYDGDDAGLKATSRNIDVLLKADAEVRVVSLPETYDPDDMIKKQGVKGFNDVLYKAVPAIDYKLKLVEDANDLRAFSGRAKYASGAVKVLKEIKDVTARAVYVTEVARKSQLSTSDLFMQIENAKDDPIEVVEKKKTHFRNDSAVLKAGRYVLNSLLTGKDFADVEKTKREWLPCDTHIEIYDFIKLKIGMGKKPIIGSLYDYIEETEEMNMVINLSEEFTDQKVEKKYYDDCVLILRNSYLNEQIEKITKIYEDETERGKKMELIAKIADMQREIRSNLDN